MRNPKRLVRSIAHAGLDVPSFGLYSRVRHHTTVGKKWQNFEHAAVRKYFPKKESYSAPIVLSAPNTTSVTTSARRISDLMR